MPRAISLIFIIPLCALVLLLPVACGGEEENEGADANAQDASAAIASSNDQAALLAAQSILQNAQTLQEQYLVEQGRYAATLEELKTVSPRLSSRLVVVSGNDSGYDMRVTAGDSNHTVLILRRSGEVVEHTDDSGGSW